MSEFITPVVGTRYRLGDEVVEVVSAVKKRYWQILVSGPFSAGPGGLETSELRRVTNAEWAAKAATIGPQP